MESNYYLQISCNHRDNSIYGFRLYDKKEKKLYCGNYLIEEAFHDYDNFLLDRDIDLILPINEQNFLKFKKLNFQTQIKSKNLNKVLIQIGLEEHGI